MSPSLLQPKMDSMSVALVTNENSDNDNIRTVRYWGELCMTKSVFSSSDLPWYFLKSQLHHRHRILYKHDLWPK